MADLLEHLPGLHDQKTHGRPKQTDSAAFREWFGDSKVVDENGEPLVVYRGGQAIDWDTGEPVNVLDRTTGFPSFDPTDNEHTEIAAFFSDDPDVAGRFANMGRPDSVAPPNNAGLFAVYVRIADPFTIDAKGEAAGTVQFGTKGRPFRDAIRSGNYDGVIIQNTADEGNLFIPLSPNQIKSATGNRGTFSADSDDIREGLLEHEGGASGKEDHKSGSPQSVHGKKGDKVTTHDGRGETHVTLGDSHGDRHNEFDPDEPNAVVPFDKFEVVSDPVSHRWEDDGYFYHVTTAEAADQIKYGGLTVGNPHSFDAGGYKDHSENRLFFTEKSGVFFWDSRIEDQLNYRYDDPPARVVVRWKKTDTRGTIQQDIEGTRDANHDAYFVEGEPGLSESLSPYSLAVIDSIHRTAPLYENVDAEKVCRDVMPILLEHEGGASGKEDHPNGTPQSVHGGGSLDVAPFKSRLSEAEAELERLKGEYTAAEYRKRIDHVAKTLKWPATADAIKLIEREKKEAERKLAATRAEVRRHKERLKLAEIAASPEFQKWSGGDVVRDKDGLPLVVYHGTENPEFVEFDPRGDDDDVGVFMSNSRHMAASYTKNLNATDATPLEAIDFADIPNVLTDEGQLETLYGIKEEFESGMTHPATFDTKSEASDYASGEYDDSAEVVPYFKLYESSGGAWFESHDRDEILFEVNSNPELRRHDGGGVYPLFVRTKDTMTVDAKGANWDSIEVDNGDGGTYTTTTRELSHEAQEMGFDGLVIENVTDYGASGVGGPEAVYVSYDSKNIKSIHNKGTWKPDSGNILESHTDRLVKNIMASDGAIYARPSVCEFIVDVGTTLQEHAQHNQLDHGNRGGGKKPTKRTLRGEFWIQDGQAVDADGDTGDMNHEAWAQQQAYYDVTDESIEEGPEIGEWIKQKAAEIREEKGIDPDDASVYDEDLVAEWADSDESGIDSDTLFIAMNSSQADFRIWAARKHGWIRIEGNHAQMVGPVTRDKLSNLSMGLGDAFDSDGEGDLDNQEIVLEVIDIPDDATIDETGKFTHTVYNVPYLFIGEVKELRDFKESWLVRTVAGESLVEHLGPGNHPNGSGQDVHGGGGGGGDSRSDNLKEWHEKGTRAKAFKNWFGDWESDSEESSQAVDDDGNPETTAPYSVVVDEDGEPIVVYHGTTHEFSEFSMERGNPENDLGAGHYFTTDTGDAQQNYAGHGPDLTNRIDQMAEQIEPDVSDAQAEILDRMEAAGIAPWADDTQTVDADKANAIADEVGEQFGIDFNDDAREVLRRYARQEFSDDSEVAPLIATERIAGDSPRMIEAYLNVRNPVVIGAPDEVEHSSYGRPSTPSYRAPEKGETVFTLSEESFDDQGRTPDDPDFDYDTQDYTGEVSGNGGTLLESIDRVSYRYDDIDTGKIREDIVDGMYDGVPAGQMVSRIKRSEGAAYATDENGTMSVGQFVSDVFQDMGHDGIKYNDASQHFKNMGIGGGTAHYIVWDSRQIKSPKNNGDFDPAKANINEGANGPTD